MTFFRNAIIISVVLLIISSSSMLWINKNTDIVDANVAEFSEQYKNDFIMSDTYHNKDCVFVYNFNGKEMSAKTTINATNMHIGDTYKLIVTKDGNMFNILFLYITILFFGFGLFLFVFSNYNFLKEKRVIKS